MVGIDIDTSEILLAKQLGDIDLIIGHHPIGRSLAYLSDVMNLQCDVLNYYGVPINIAEGLMKERIQEVSRGTSASNHQKTVDSAKLLNQNLINIHTPCDNLAAQFLRIFIDSKKPETVGELVDTLKRIPEYKEGMKVGSGPKIFVGNPENRCGKIALTEITGGTEGSPKLFEKMANAGIGTVVGMHISEEGKKQAEEANINVVIAGHISSDSLGVNLFLDELEKKGIQIHLALVLLESQESTNFCIKMDNVFIAKQKDLKEIKDKILKQGAKSIFVLADFDRTLVKAFVDGKRVSSLISVLRDEDYLTPDYPDKAKALFEKYHAVEMDLDISLEEKSQLMKEWWTKHFELLIASGLNKKDLEKAVESNNLVLRDGIPKFLNTLKDNNIPLVILSSSGLGQEAISLYLEKKDLLSDNIDIISNSFEWDKEGKAISVKEPIIHMLNKKIGDYSVETIKDKTNVLLLGDSLSDVEMIQGFDYENVIKIVFLNEDVDNNLERYKEVYDIVITNDSSAEYINTLLSEII